MSAGTPDVAGVLGSHYAWLESLPARQRAALLAHVAHVELPRGATVFDSGDACRGFPLVVAGSVRVSKVGPDGREILLYRVGPGETCILTSSCLLGAADYTARAVAETPVTVCVLPREQFLELLSAHEPFRQEIFRLFAERLAELMALVDAVAFQRLDQRLATRLLGHGAVVEASHQALALELGSVREIVTRILGELESRGLVALSRGRIEIRDAARLRAVAERGL